MHLTAVQDDLETVVANRRWLRREDPFPHIVAHNVFTDQFYSALANTFQACLARGLAEGKDPNRFSPYMGSSSFYSLDPNRDRLGSFKILLSRPWHDLFADALGVEATGDLHWQFHHHRPGAPSGHVHNDLNPGWFSKTAADRFTINGSDLKCSYSTGKAANGEQVGRQVIRAIAVLFYLNNPPWKPGDGGETGLYGNYDDPVNRPRATAAPINNSLLAFECTPYSYHTFMGGSARARNSFIFWLHRPREYVLAKWGEGFIRYW